MTNERSELIAILRKQRESLIHTTRDLTDEQAALTPTASSLCLGGLIKHVGVAERRWVTFATGGAEAMQAEPVDWENVFRMTGGDTLAGLVATYREVGAGTEKLIETVPDLDLARPLPVAPWFEKGSWSIRRVILHIVAETAQHAGHADIIRESIDGATTTG